MKAGRWGRWLVTLVIAAVAVTAVASLYLVPPEMPAPRPRAAALSLPTERPEQGRQVIPVHSQGIARARHQLPLSMEVNGRVESVSPALADGGLVQAGDVLLSLDPEPFELEVTSRQNSVNAARLHLAETRAKARVAGASSRQSALGRFEPQMDEARSRLAAALAGLRQAQRNQEMTQLVAPVSGRLKAVQVSVGQHVQAGMTLAELYQEQQVQVRLPVRDEWLALLGITPGDDSSLANVAVHLEGRFAGRQGQWQGRVVRREGGLNRNQMMTLIVLVENTDSGLPLEPGVLVEATLSGKPMAGITVLPASALAGDSAVWVLDDQQRLRRHPVNVLYRDQDRVYLDDRLAGNQPVVLAGDLQLLEGMRIDPRPVTEGLAKAGNEQ
ncbi:HlyD family secretion protein [Alcanivorax hongdengensis A-11-3]|uniref:HlyD family secretion protein n=2 Tax=Alcanivorax hongdengensis TaxID=519051 RepID=L0W9P3_9GAMM|nr:HlyD family secretion protein [Alcanivorax hongdengensis A-11-3]